MDSSSLRGQVLPMVKTVQRWLSSFALPTSSPLPSSKHGNSVIKMQLGHKEAQPVMLAEKMLL